jgi:hypothetical protein
MKRECEIYIASWFQRTALHLIEFYNFLKNKESVPGLEGEKGKELLKSVNLKNIHYNEDQRFDNIIFSVDNQDASMTEDGIFMIKTKKTDVLKNIKSLEKGYNGFLIPAFEYLFKKGASISKEFGMLKETNPIYFVYREASKEECLNQFKEMGEEFFSSIKSNDLEIYFGDRISLINVLNSKFSDLEEVIRYLVLAREFERQLHYYLNFHRNVWDKIAAIRKFERITNKEFTNIDEELKHYLEVLLIVKARLAQMKEIISNRETNIDSQTKKLLEGLKFYHRLGTLKENHDYIYHLWNMTIDYTFNTQNYLNSAYSKLTSKELTVLRVVTIASLIIAILKIEVGNVWAKQIYGFSAGLILLVGLFCLTLISYFVIKKVIFRNKIRIKGN